MYTLFNDRTEIFEAKIKLAGASLNESKCRLVVEGQNFDLIFNGDIDSIGNCKITMKGLQGVLPEGSTGKMKLEVIADDTYFTPWSSEYEVDTTKQVTVEVKAQPFTEKSITVEQADATIIPHKTTNKPKPLHEVQHTNNNTLVKRFTKKLLSAGVTVKNLREHKELINQMSNNLIFEDNISESERKKIVSKSLKIIAKRTKR